VSSIENKVEQLKTLIEISSLINSSLNLNEVKKRAIESLTKLLDAEAGSLILIDQESGEMFFEVATGEKGKVVKEFRLKKGEGIAGWVANTGDVLIVNDVQNDDRFLRTFDEKTNFKTRNMICVPLITRGKILGVMEVLNKKKGDFSDEDKDILIALANQVAIAIENAQLYEELRDTFYSTVQALADTIEKRDYYTGEHIKRVMNYSYQVGGAIGLSKKELEDLKLAAILHDVGKIGVSDQILLKNEKLDDKEAEIMSKHAELGAEILSHIKALKDIIPGVRSHHERIDGKGYPDGLKDEEIPIIAKIIAVADTFDALTSNRPYRDAISHERALEELKKNAGIQFDKRIVDVFIRLFKEGIFEDR